MQGQDLIDWVNARISQAERAEVPAIDADAEVSPWAFQPLAPTRFSLLLGEGLLVRYHQAEDAQLAFNMAASLLPERVKLKATKEQGGPEWMHVPAGVRDGDPMGQAGFVGWRVERALRPGEYIARARLHSIATYTVTFVDVVVTAETIHSLRASGMYAEIIAPKAMEHGGGSTCIEGTGLAIGGGN